MAQRTYIGARYVPLFIGEWDNTVSYEPLSIVMHEGDSYTSRQHVPVGIDIDNGTFWALTSAYNAQIDEYRGEVADLASDVSGLENIIPSSEYSSASTVKDAIDQCASDITALGDIIPSSEYSSASTVKDAIDQCASDITALGDIIPSSEYSSASTVKDAIDQCASDITALETAVFTETSYTYNQMLSSTVEDYTIRSQSEAYKRCGVISIGLSFTAVNGYTANTDVVVGYLIPELKPARMTYLPAWDEGVHCYIDNADGAIHYRSTAAVTAGSNLKWIRAPYMAKTY